MALQIWFYPGMIFLLLVVVLVALPRDTLRLLVPLGLILGGLVDTFCTLICSDLLGIYSYTSPPLFDVSGHLILAPIAWSLVIVFFLYFWPKYSKQLGYFYVLTWGLLATGVSQVVHYLGLFDYSDWLYPLPMLFLFLLRFALAAWIAKPWTNSWA